MIVQAIILILLLLVHIVLHTYYILQYLYSTAIVAYVLSIAIEYRMPTSTRTDQYYYMIHIYVLIFNNINKLILLSIIIIYLYV